MAKPEFREWGLRMVVVARTIERIGDRAVDIGEQTAYLLTAEFREFTDASHPGRLRLTGRGLEPLQSDLRRLAAPPLGWAPSLGHREGKYPGHGADHRGALVPQPSGRRSEVEARMRKWLRIGCARVCDRVRHPSRVRPPAPVHVASHQPSMVEHDGCDLPERPHDGVIRDRLRCALVRAGSSGE